MRYMISLRFMNSQRFVNLWRCINLWRYMNLWRYKNLWRYMNLRRCKNLWRYMNLWRFMTLSLSLFCCFAATVQICHEEEPVFFRSIAQKRVGRGESRFIIYTVYELSLKHRNGLLSSFVQCFSLLLVSLCVKPFFSWCCSFVSLPLCFMIKPH